MRKNDKSSWKQTFLDQGKLEQGSPFDAKDQQLLLNPVRHKKTQTAVARSRDRNCNRKIWEKEDKSYCY